MKTVTITFVGGSATVETAGFAGKSCQDETAEFEKLLGIKTNDVPTAEALKPAVKTTGTPLTQRH